MGLRAGSLNERLKILREVRVDSDFGGSETEYQFKCYIRAYHNAKDGNRTIINDEIVYTNTKTFETSIKVIRYLSSSKKNLSTLQ